MGGEGEGERELITELFVKPTDTNQFLGVKALLTLIIARKK